MSESQPNPLKFFGLVQEMEVAIGYVTDVFDLIEHIDAKQYVTLRDKIIDVFQIGESMPKFDKSKFGSDVEFGDISDAIRLTTMTTYPQSTPMDKPISVEERIIWCDKILKNMDAAASYDY
ncbi:MULTISPECIES: hypothetical protein [Vibrio]|uniref:hypothetical protein n=1 Tax=Vibrio TaxID=662 RepID=UPI001B82AEDA|nr:MULTISPECIES: hypothetical protein [Vibrio]BDP38313.1 hypothetical protein VA208B3_46840 [Vibrio alginolyticus]MDF5646538.1 hypothetical protein [Vibrio parahaemolyticus]MDF5666204.1 hypothetical protein [Vibrio parahaemolyticus]WKV19460.1 hypothetical protein [Vibrio parahaemolyticus]BDP33443.1 hypothetical protein VV208B2_45230 [Vibrio vulnificus]